MVVCLPAPEGFELDIVSSSFPAALRIHRADVRYWSSPWEFSSSGLVSTAWSLSAEPGRPVCLNSASENRAEKMEEKSRKWLQRGELLRIFLLEFGHLLLTED